MRSRGGAVRQRPLLPSCEEIVPTSNLVDAAVENGSRARPCSGAGLRLGLLSGGGDRHYAFGLAMSLADRGVIVDFVGGDETDSPEFHLTPGLTYFNLRRNGRKNAGLAEKIARIVAYYVRLMWYAATAKPRVFHILWNNKFEAFDRTLLMVFYKALGKKVTLTAHNVNAGVRDSEDTRWNRMTLGVQYRLADQIFVHTKKMKDALTCEFNVREDRVTIIPYGINNAVPVTSLTPEQAKQKLGIAPGERTILFFGNIAPYKGLEYLISAFERLVAGGGNYRLIIAGRAKQSGDPYVDSIQQALRRDGVRERSVLKLEFVPDEETELYFKAADVSVLPYTYIFQSGVLFLGYSFGLPVIATDVGSLREDIVEGETGYVVPPQNSDALANAIEKYFASPLYAGLNKRRHGIQDWANARHSWDLVAEITADVYASLLGKGTKPF